MSSTPTESGVTPGNPLFVRGGMYLTKVQKQKRTLSPDPRRQFLPLKTKCIGVTYQPMFPIKLNMYIELYWLMSLVNMNGEKQQIYVRNRFGNYFFQVALYNVQQTAIGRNDKMLSIQCSCWIKSAAACGLKWKPTRSRGKVCVRTQARCPMHFVFSYFCPIQKWYMCEYDTNRSNRRSSLCTVSREACTEEAEHGILRFGLKLKILFAICCNGWQTSFIPENVNHSKNMFMWFKSKYDCPCRWMITHACLQDVAGVVQCANV